MLSNNSIIDINHHDIGVVYVAFGYEYLIMALNSYRTLRNHHEDIPVTLITNVAVNNSVNSEGREILNICNSNDIFDEIHYIDDENENNRLYKTSVYEFSPYDRTLFLDVDTEIKSSIDQGFNFLDYFDIAFVLAPYPITTMVDNWEGDAHLDNLPLKNACRWNSGVFFFKKSVNTERFFQRWSNKYKEFGYNADQFSLINSVYNSSVRIMSLDLSWNANSTTMKFDERIRSNLKIHHYSEKLWKLRSFERQIGDKILKYPDEVKNELRKEYQSKYSLRNEIKERLDELLLLS